MKLTIYNVVGESVKELNPGIQKSGNYEINLNANGLASGVYFYTLHSTSVDGKHNFVNTKKMIVMR